MGTIFDSFLLVTDGMAMIGFPLPSKPSAAPRIKSTCPPNPEYILVPMESAFTCPVKSIERIGSINVVTEPLLN